LARRELRQKRGGGKVQDQAACVTASSDEGLLAQVPDPEPTPAFAALVAEEYQRLLGLLGDAVPPRVAVLKMEGYTVDEFAAQMNVTPRTVKRWLQLIRRIWEQELQQG
jgi:DNA-directed RNA polymerase specialized sigma24 family protein